MLYIRNHLIALLTTHRSGDLFRVIAERSTSRYIYGNRLGGLLAPNQTQQDTLHRVKLGGVDERIDAVVQI